MSIYLSLDAGGSKCAAMLFDDDLNLLGSGLSGGVNTTQTTLDEARANVVDCLNQVFQNVQIDQIDRFYYSFVGPVHVLREEITRRVRVICECGMSEPEAGMYAGALRKEGLLSLAGTGSDVFWVKHSANGRRLVVGSWGPILGDQGSGTWIGQRVLREVVKLSEGWGEQTILLDMIRKAWALEHDYDMVRVVHQSPAPFRKVASLTVLVGEAARQNDAFALKVLREAGEQMALQTICLIEREQVPPEMRAVTCCGGAWKAHSAMFERFREMLQERYPGLSVQKPWFEHLMAGPARTLIERGIEIPEAKRLLETHFPKYVIRW